MSQTISAHEKHNKFQARNFTEFEYFILHFHFKFKVATFVLNNLNMVK